MENTYKKEIEEYDKTIEKYANEVEEMSKEIVNDMENKLANIEIDENNLNR